MNASSTDMDTNAPMEGELSDEHDPFDLQLNCRCGRALTPFSDYDPELGDLLVYAVDHLDAALYQPYHDHAVVTRCLGTYYVSQHKGRCPGNGNGKGASA